MNGYLLASHCGTAEQGAAGILRPAVVPELADVAGPLLRTGRRQRSPEISYDRDLQQRVWAASHACIVTTEPVDISITAT